MFSSASIGGCIFVSETPLRRTGCYSHASSAMGKTRVLIADEVLCAESARKLRAHIPGCTATAVTNLNPNRMIRKISSREDQDAENYRYWQSRPIGERLAARL